MDLAGAIFSLLTLTHWLSSLRYSCWSVQAVSADLCVVAMVTSSAYEAILVFVCGAGDGMSCMYRLKRVGERTEPCGTPLGKLRVMDCLF